MLLTTANEMQFWQLSFAKHAQEVLEFFEQNQHFFLTIENTLPSTQMVEDIFTSVPAGIKVSQKQLIGIYRENRLLAFIELIKDRYNTHEWLLALFIVNINDRGQGLGKLIIQNLETYLCNIGVTCLGLGVIESNTPALAFWTQMNYIRVEKTHKQKMGDQWKRVIPFYKEFHPPPKT